MNDLIQQITKLVTETGKIEDIQFVCEQVSTLMTVLSTPKGNDLTEWLEVAQLVERRALDLQKAILMKADGVTPAYKNIPESEEETYELYFVIYNLSCLIHDLVHAP